MNTKIMEGLVGAGTNRELLNTPMRVYREARHRGDTMAMERAMGYVSNFADRAEEYKTKASEGMEEDAREAREKAELERERAIKKRREERERLEERIDENRSANIDTVEISEAGKALLKEKIDLDNVVSAEPKVDVVKEPLAYKQTGESQRVADTSD